MSKGQGKVEWSLDLGKMRVRAGQVVSDVMGGRAETKRASLSEPRQGAVSAQIEIAFPVGGAALKALEAESPSLVEAELTYVGEYAYSVSGDTERRISLRQAGALGGDFGAMDGNASDLRWDIAVARNLPLQLKLFGGVGEASIDLSGLQIADLQVETGVGRGLLDAAGTRAPD